MASVTAEDRAARGSLGQPASLARLAESCVVRDAALVHPTVAVPAVSFRPWPARRTRGVWATSASRNR